MEKKTIYAGNLPLDWDEAQLRRRFAEHGQVLSATVLTEPQSGRSRGFGFVEMASTEADAAIEALDGLEIEDCFLRVNESRDRGARPPRRRY